MGGIGSGARRSTHIGNVEEMLALDIRALRRLGVVAPGECVIDTLHWSIGGLSTARARLIKHLASEGNALVPRHGHVPLNSADDVVVSLSGVVRLIHTVAIKGTLRVQQVDEEPANR